MFTVVVCYYLGIIKLPGAIFLGVLRLDDGRVDDLVLDVGRRSEISMFGIRGQGPMS
jgi:hypothetical protein